MKAPWVKIRYLRRFHLSKRLSICIKAPQKPHKSPTN
nr:MAG TPA: hypothetical protein [Caudoviricetes sp.]